MIVFQKTEAAGGNVTETQLLPPLSDLAALIAVDVVDELLPTAT
jgi:hypothetical protein